MEWEAEKLEDIQNAYSPNLRLLLTFSAIGKDANFSFKTRGLNVDVIPLSLKGMNRNERTNIYFGILNLFTFSLMISETELNSNVSKWRKGKKILGRDTTRFLGFRRSFDSIMERNVLENFHFGKTFHTELTTNLCCLDDVVIGLAGVVWGATACVCVQTTFEKGRHYQQTDISCWIRAENCWSCCFEVGSGFGRSVLCKRGFTMHGIEFHLLIDMEAWKPITFIETVKPL